MNSDAEREGSGLVDESLREQAIAHLRQADEAVPVRTDSGSITVWAA
jgi:hypothetical protein